MTPTRQSPLSLFHVKLVFYFLPLCTIIVNCEWARLKANCDGNITVAHLNVPSRHEIFTHDITSPETTVINPKAKYEWPYTDVYILWFCDLWFWNFKDFLTKTFNISGMKKYFKEGHTVPLQWKVVAPFQLWE